MSDNSAADRDWEEAESRAKVLAELPEQLTEGDFLGDASVGCQPGFGALSAMRESVKSRESYETTPVSRILARPFS